MLLAIIVFLLLPVVLPVVAAIYDSVQTHRLFSSTGRDAFGTYSGPR